MGGDGPETRTALRSDGYVVWNPQDEIHVYYGTQSGKFTSTNTTQVTTATFKGRMGEVVLDNSKSFLGVYPFSASLSADINGDGFGVYLPSEQHAVAGGFEDDLFLSAGRSLNFDLYFYNLCGGVKFSLTEPGVKRVVFSGNRGETLAGTGYFNYPLGEVPVFSYAGTDSDEQITLYAPDGGTFQTGVWYYLVAFPCVLSEGYTIDLYSASSLIATIENRERAEIKRAKWGVLRELGAPKEDPKAVLSASPLAMDFGPVKVGETAQQTLTVVNSGDASAIMGFSLPMGYSINPGPVVEITAGQTRQFAVSFSPSSAIDYSGTIRIDYGGTEDIFVSLSGSGIEDSDTGVDLGLSVKWASCNIGASSPEEYGGFYSWGGIATQNTYDWGSYRYGSGPNSVDKYCISSDEGRVDNLTVLRPEDDVATQTLKGGWRIPTEAEFKELMEKCDWTWSTWNGRYGYKIVSRINGGQIFLPAPGQKYNDQWANKGTVGYYWTSELSGYSGFARGLCLSSSKRQWMNYSRHYGLSVRAVCGGEAPVSPPDGGDEVPACLSVSKESVELYAVVGDPYTTTIQLINGGNQAVTIDAVNCPDYISTSCVRGMVIGAGQKVDIAITFTPTDTWCSVDTPITIQYGKNSVNVGIKAFGGKNQDVTDLAERGLFDCLGITIYGLKEEGVYSNPEEGIVLSFEDTEVGDYSCMSLVFTNKDSDSPIRFIMYGDPPHFYNDEASDGWIYSSTLINSWHNTVLQGRKDTIEIEEYFFPKAAQTYSATYSIIIVFEFEDAGAGGVCFPLTFKGEGVVY